MNGNTPHRWSALLCLVLVATALLLAFRIYMQDRHIARQQDEIRAIELDIAEIQIQLPGLRSLSKGLLEMIDSQTVPVNAPFAWCMERIGFPHCPPGFSRSGSPAQTRLPLGMDVPWALRQADPYVHPGLAPYQAKVVFEGSASKIHDFLDEMHMYYPAVIVTELDLQSTGSDMRFSGYALLAFPQILDIRDLDRIREFARSEP